MKTILTETIDGYEIITGFGTLTIDPEATKQAAIGLIEETDEHKATVTKSEEMQRISKARSESITAAKTAYNNKDTSLHAKHCYDVELRNIQLNALTEEAVDLLKARKEKAEEIRLENLVYFEPKSGEQILEDDSVCQKYMDLGKKELLTTSGEIIADNRGVKYVKDGKICEVTELGKEPEGELIENVTAEEFEVMRLENLTDDEKAAELETVISGLKSQAITLRSGYEIDGMDSAEALTKVQEWLAEETADAELKYNN